MGKVADWLAFEAIPRAIERSRIRRLPYPVRVAIAIPLLITLVVGFALLALLVAAPLLLPAYSKYWAGSTVCPAAIPITCGRANSNVRIVSATGYFPRLSEPVFELPSCNDARSRVVCDS